MQLHQLATIREKKCSKRRGPPLNRDVCSFKDSAHMYFISEYPLFGTLDSFSDLRAMVPESSGKLSGEKRSSFSGPRSSQALREGDQSGLQNDTFLLTAGQIDLELEYLQACGLIYRSLKPINVTIFADSYLKLVGFELAARGEPSSRVHLWVHGSGTTFCWLPVSPPMSIGGRLICCFETTLSHPLP